MNTGMNTPGPESGTETAADPVLLDDLPVEEGLRGGLGPGLRARSIHAGVRSLVLAWVRGALGSGVRRPHDTTGETGAHLPAGRPGDPPGGACFPVGFGL